MLNTTIKRSWTPQRSRGLNETRRSVDGVAAPLIRLPVAPSATNGLRVACSLMIDKIHTVPKSKFGQRVGTLDHEDVIRLNRAMVVFLGLASTTSRRKR